MEALPGSMKPTFYKKYKGSVKQDADTQVITEVVKRCAINQE